MTDKELRKLSRAELLTLLIEVTEENERLTGILERRGVQAADGAAGGVPEGVTEDVQGVFHSLESTAVGFLKEARGISDQIILEAQERAEQMIAQARQQAEMIARGEAPADAGFVYAAEEGTEASPAAGQAEAFAEAHGIDLPEASLEEVSAAKSVEVREEAYTTEENTEETPTAGYAEAFDEAEDEEYATEEVTEVTEEPQAAEQVEGSDEAQEEAYTTEEDTEENTEAYAEDAPAAEPDEEPVEAQDLHETESGDAASDRLADIMTEEEFVLPWLAHGEEDRVATHPVAVHRQEEDELPADAASDSRVSVEEDGEKAPADAAQDAAAAQSSADTPTTHTTSPVPEETPLTSEVTLPGEPAPAQSPASAEQSAPQKPLTAIDMLRMMQQGGRK